MNVWLAVTSDRYELPKYVADSAAELGRMVGVTEQAVRRAKHFGSIARRGPMKGCRVIRVEVTDDERQ